MCSRSNQLKKELSYDYLIIDNQSRKSLLAPQEKAINKDCHLFDFRYPFTPPSPLEKPKSKEKKNKESLGQEEPLDDHDLTSRPLGRMRNNKYKKAPMMRSLMQQEKK